MTTSDSGRTLMEHRPIHDGDRSDLGGLPGGRRAQRDDYPGPAGMTEAQRLIAMGQMLQSATIVGSPAPSVRWLSERMRHPRLGDLVWETSTVWRSLRDAEWADKALGWFVECGRSPYASREEWESADCEWREYSGQPYAECPARCVWVIRPWGNPDGQFVWENADLAALPLDYPADDLFRLVP